MGYAISYTSTGSVSESEFASIKSVLEQIGSAFTWLSCEPLWLMRTADGTLYGASKPNFDPHPDDVKSAEQEGLPDGTLRELLDGLCLLSRRFQIEWLIGDDYTGEIGYIRDGDFDDAVWNHIDGLAEATPNIRTMMGDLDDLTDPESEDDGRDDDDPPIFKFPGRDS